MEVTKATAFMEVEILNFPYKDFGDKLLVGQGEDGQLVLKLRNHEYHVEATALDFAINFQRAAKYDS